jgi:mycofactocin precursor
VLVDPGQCGPDEDPEDWHERTDRQRDHTGRAPAPQLTSPAEDESPVAEELLVEEVSIDGMCGVY